MSTLQNAEKKRVLLIQTGVPHYRMPIFNELASRVELTVMYEKGDVPKEAEFQTIKVDTFKARFRFHKLNILRIAKKYDVVIMMLDGSYFTTRLLCYLRGKTALILWGIGVSAGYQVRFDEDPVVVEAYARWIKKADAALFYSSYPIARYTEKGISADKLFVADNTVAVLPFEACERNEILFIGSLYKAKKIFELLQGYANAYCQNPAVPPLTIVGDGEEYENVKAWIAANDLTDKITLAGAIFDDAILKNYFARALMCISPDQAGLSVLKSFGYGVPFITHKDAITGGERLNIEDGVNGLLFDSFDEIPEIIKECADFPDHYIEMGKNAKKYYDENRTVNHMVSGFIDAINFVTEKQTTEAGK